MPVATHTSTPLAAAARSASATRRVTRPSPFRSVPSRSTTRTSARARGAARRVDVDGARGTVKAVLFVFVFVFVFAAGGTFVWRDAEATAAPRSPASAEAMRPSGPLARSAFWRLPPGRRAGLIPSLAASARRSALSTRDISLACSSPSSWSMPARCAMPCASKTRHSSASAWPRSRACLAAVSTETTQSPRTVTSPKPPPGTRGRPWRRPCLATPR